MADVTCPDCDGTRGTFSSYGNGKCYHCDGDGFTYEFADKVQEFATQEESTTECRYCHGSGVCQTCDGKGYTSE